MPRREKLSDRNILFIAVAAVLVASGPAVATQAASQAYAEAVRCAALTNAASKVGADTPQSSQLFDHVIFWGMAAADAGRAAGKGTKAVDADVAREASGFEAKLRAQDGATAAALADCVRRVPPAAND